MFMSWQPFSWLSNRGLLYGGISGAVLCTSGALILSPRADEPEISQKAKDHLRRTYTYLAASTAITAGSAVLFHRVGFSDFMMQLSPLRATLIESIPLTCLIITKIIPKGRTLKRVLWAATCITTGAALARTVYQPEVASAVLTVGGVTGGFALWARSLSRTSKMKPRGALVMTAAAFAATQAAVYCFPFFEPMDLFSLLQSCTGIAMVEAYWLFHLGDTIRRGDVKPQIDPVDDALRPLNDTFQILIRLVRQVLGQSKKRKRQLKKEQADEPPK